MPVEFTAVVLHNYLRMKRNRGGSASIILILLIILGLIGVLGYSVYKNGVFKTTSSNMPLVSPTPLPLTVVPTDWKTYSNADYKYSAKYPPDWTIDEKKDYKALALMTTTIVSPDGNSLFDIWVREGDWEQVKKELLSKNYTQIKINNIITLASPNKPESFTLQSKNPNQIIQIVYSGNAETTPTLKLILNTFRLEQ